MVKLVSIEAIKRAEIQTTKKMVNWIRKNCPVIYKVKGKHREYGVTEEELQKFLQEKR